jgi:hypothetical protein
VQAGQRDTDWPAFVFITTEDGAGWVPERHLDTSADPAVVITAYDTTELATTAGEELAVITQDDPSGWAWVRNAAEYSARDKCLRFGADRTLDKPYPPRPKALSYVCNAVPQLFRRKPEARAWRVPWWIGWGRKPVCGF